MDNHHLVTIEKMLEFMRYTDDRVGLEVFFDKISYEMIRLCVETITVDVRLCPHPSQSKTAYLLVISSIIIIELGCASALAKTKS